MNKSIHFCPLFCILIMLLCGQAMSAQEKAFTAYGDQVWLHDDGTWTYADDNRDSFDINETLFVKSDEADFMYESQVFNLGIWMDTVLWEVNDDTINEFAEYEWYCPSADLYGMLISEDVEFPLESFPIIAIENDQGAIPDIRIIFKEIRTVNDTKVLYMRLRGTYEQIPVQYEGYYFSNPIGSAQLIIYSSEQLMDKHSDVVKRFLNGIVELPR